MKKPVVLWSLLVLLAFAACDLKKETPVDATPGEPYWPTEDWRTIAPEAEGLDSDGLEDLDKAINKSYPHIHSFLVVRHGYLIFEKYYSHQGSRLGKDDLHPLASATKTFTGALVGIAIKDGFVKDIAQKVAGYFPNDTPANPDPRLLRLEVRHLLAMTGGFDWNDANDNPYIDRISFALGRPMKYEPGSVFNYDSPGSHLLSAIITATTGMSALAFADLKLFNPLGITRRSWDSDNRGHSHGDFMLALRPRDMAKLGYLYLKNGGWDGTQIVPADWVRDSTSQQNLGGGPHNAGYGYQCWVTTDSGHPAFFAGGFGGQFIYVVPGLDLVVAITSDWDRHHEENRSLVGRYVIPAIKK